MSSALLRNDQSALHLSTLGAPIAGAVDNWRARHACAAARLASPRGHRQSARRVPISRIGSAAAFIDVDRRSGETPRWSRTPGGPRTLPARPPLPGSGRSTGTQIRTGSSTPPSKNRSRTTWPATPTPSTGADRLPPARRDRRRHQPPTVHGALRLPPPHRRDRSPPRHAPRTARRYNRQVEGSCAHA